MRLKNAIHASTYIRGYPMLTLYIADVERDVGMKKLSQEEAAKVLEDMKVKMEIPKAAVMQWKRNTALDMAIEALKYSEIPNSSNLISRQAAIRWVKTECNPYGKPTLEFESGKKVIKHLAQMPSAQPEPLTDREQRIFLAAIGREEKVCKEVDEEYTREPYEDSLVRVCREIKRKVKKALWTN